MIDLFCQYIIDEYNEKFSNYIVFNCPCYKNYDQFKECIFVERKSYTCCIFLKQYSKIAHLTLPVMIGSAIDKTIRGKIGDTCKYGGFLINGNYKIIPNFITNNLRTGYVYRRTGQKLYKWKWRRNSGHAVTLDYGDEHEAKRRSHYTVTCVETRKKLKEKQSGKRRLRNDFTHTEIENWVEAINEESPFESATEEGYIDFFKCSLEHYPLLDDLANKTVITPPEILLRAIERMMQSDTEANVNYAEYHKKEKANRVSQCTNRLRATLISGNLFYALSSKNIETFVKDFKTIWLAIEGHKIDTISRLVSNVKRYISRESRNSNALLYPRDAMDFICPLNVKEMSEAGENLSLAQFVIMAKEVPVGAVKSTFKRYSDPGKSLPVVLEGFVTKYRINAEDVLPIKSKNTNICFFMYAEKYAVAFYKGHTPLKYSPKYGVFLSPYEASRMFPDAFSDYSILAKFSTVCLQLPESIVRMQPAKSTVSVNNIKGACAVIDHHMSGFIFSIGQNNTALNYTDLTDDIEPATDIENWRMLEQKDGNEKILADIRAESEARSRPVVDSGCRTNEHYSFDTFHKSIPMIMEIENNKRKESVSKYLRYARLAGCEMPAAVSEFFGACPPPLKSYECTGATLANLLPDPEADLAKINKSMKRIKYYANRMLYVPSAEFVESFVRSDALVDHKPETAKTGYKSSQLISSSDHTKIFGEKSEYMSETSVSLGSPFRNHLILYAGFGDIGGGTVEDGLIIDRRFHENSPQKVTSVSLTVKFEPIDSKLKIGDCELKYHDINKRIGHFVLFGILFSRNKLTSIKSKNVKVKEYGVGGIYRYQVYMHEYSGVEKVVDSKLAKMELSLHYHYSTRIGIGTKISNQHGQKGIVADIRDLSAYKAWKRDGTCVHPQVLFSKQSVVGRTLSSQAYETLNGDFAVSEFGEIVAPLSFNIVHIEVNTKVKIMAPKNDVMTAENGFVGNSLSVCPKLMALQVPENRYGQMLHVQRQMLKVNGISVIYTDFSDDKIFKRETAS